MRIELVRGTKGNENVKTKTLKLLCEGLRKWHKMRTEMETHKDWRIKTIFTWSEVF